VNDDDDDDSEIDADSSSDAEEESHDRPQIDSAKSHMNHHSSAEQSNDERDVSETQSTSIASSETE